MLTEIDEEMSASSANKGVPLIFRPLNAPPATLVPKPTPELGDRGQSAYWSAQSHMTFRNAEAYGGGDSFSTGGSTQSAGVVLAYRTEDGSMRPSELSSYGARAVAPLPPPSPILQFRRIAVVMVAYGLFSTLLAGNQTVAALG